jgi:hypothetical protein
MNRARGAVSLARVAIVMVGVAVAVVGCHKVAGGGWLAGVNGGKATFGFQGQCDDIVLDLDGPVPGLVSYEGQFQYHDKGANVSFHGDVNWDKLVFFPFGNAPSSCKEWVATLPVAVHDAEFSGECVSRPGGVTGTFKVTVVDNGKPGPGAGDEITVATPNYFVQDVYETDGDGNYVLDEDGWLIVIGQEIVPIGDPCTNDGQAYSNSGIVGGGNIVMPGEK